MAGNLEKILGGPLFFNKTPAPPETQLLTQMSQFDLYPETITLDGVLHRFQVDTSKDAGWYVAFGDGVPAGKFGNWRTGEEVHWRADVGRELTVPEQMAHSRRMAEIKEIRDQALIKKHETASSVVQKIWELAGLASDEHPYLKKKGVKAHGLRITGDGRLIAPLYSEDGTLSSLQYITGDGDKQYHPGGAVKYCSYTLGVVSDFCYIVEGYATGATVYETTGKPVVVAYSAGNLLNMAEVLRKKSPSLSMTIVADNDESGVGQAKAEQAAAKYGAAVIMPPIQGDANDFVQQGGDLVSLLEPTTTAPWLTWMDEFCKQPAPIRWLVKHWVQDNALIMVHGPSGCGKTFTVLDWCMRIASGMDEWCGERVREGNVIYLAGEGHQGLRGRAAAWKQRYNPDHVNMAISRGGTDLNTPEGLHKTISAIREINANPAIIVVDTLHRFLDGDENSAQDTKTMLDACAILMSEFDCSVLLVHHTGVNPEAQARGRGSSAWKGALDIEISVEKKAKEPIIKIIQRKNKDAELSPDKTLELETVSIEGWYDEDGEQVTSAVVVESGALPEVNVKLGDDKQNLIDAWEYSGANFEDDLPYLTNSAWRNYLTEKGGRELNDARQDVKLSATGRLANRLLSNNIIEKFDNGIVIIDNALVSTLSMVHLVHCGTF
jgi:phage/plasmid primase-like uncharacterized protein